MEERKYTKALKGIQDICMDDYNKLMDRQMGEQL